MTERTPCMAEDNRQAPGLPGWVEIVPPVCPVNASLTVPGSKSLTNRALVLAALAEGSTVLEGALWSEDTQVMVGGLQQLGFQVRVDPDPLELCNRRLIVQGQGGYVPPGGSASEPLELFVGNAGTAARFLAAFVCLGSGFYRLQGVPRMHHRPQQALFDALRQLGYEVRDDRGRLPAIIQGGGPRAAACSISIAESSQFASALQLCAKIGQWEIHFSDENEEESPYVAMTTQLQEVFPSSGGTFQIEPDASSGSYFWAANWLLNLNPATSPSHVSVRHWPDSGWQIDAEFPRFLPLPGHISRQQQLGDSIMTAIVVAPFSDGETRFTELARLRMQECERVEALRSELIRCGANVREEGQSLIIHPGPLHGAEIQTYNDHRMAMCFAILGLKVPGVRIQNPACVKKTFPNFFQKLAAAPPHGLGVGILDSRQRPLPTDLLLAH